MTKSRAPLAGLKQFCGRLGNDGDTLESISVISE